MSRLRRPRPVRIGEVLRETVAGLGWERRLAEEDAVTRWPEAVGPRIAAHAVAVRLAAGRLTVMAANSVWAQQLSLLKPELLRRLAERCGPGLVTEIFVVTGRVDLPPAAPEPPARSTPPPPVELPEAVEREIAAIADEEVRRSVARTARASLAGRGS